MRGRAVVDYCDRRTAQLRTVTLRWMFGSRHQHRLAVVCLVLAVLFGGLPRIAELRGVVTLDAGSERTSAVLADAAPAGVVVTAVRLRTSQTSDLAFDTRWIRTGPAGLASGLLGLGMAAVAWWWLRRREHGAAMPVPSRTPATLRAPPLGALT